MSFHEYTYGGPAPRRDLTTRSGIGRYIPPEAVRSGSALSKLDAEQRGWLTRSAQFKLNRTLAVTLPGSFSGYNPVTNIPIFASNAIREDVLHENLHRLAPNQFGGMAPTGWRPTSAQVNIYTGGHGGAFGPGLRSYAAEMWGQRQYGEAIYRTIQSYTGSPGAETFAIAGQAGPAGVPPQQRQFFSDIFTQASFRSAGLYPRPMGFQAPGFERKPRSLYGISN